MYHSTCIQCDALTYVTLHRNVSNCIAMKLEHHCVCTKYKRITVRSSRMFVKHLSINVGVSSIKLLHYSHWANGQVSLHKYGSHCKCTELITQASVKASLSAVHGSITVFESSCVVMLELYRHGWLVNRNLKFFDNYL